MPKYDRTPGQRRCPFQHPIQMIILARSYPWPGFDQFPTLSSLLLTIYGTNIDTYFFRCNLDYNLKSKSIELLVAGLIVPACAAAAGLCPDDSLTSCMYNDIISGGLLVRVLYGSRPSVVVHNMTPQSIVSSKHRLWKSNRLRCLETFDDYAVCAQTLKTKASNVDVAAAMYPEIIIRLK